MSTKAGGGAGRAYPFSEELKGAARLKAMHLFETRPEQQEWTHRPGMEAPEWDRRNTGLGDSRCSLRGEGQEEN